MIYQNMTTKELQDEAATIAFQAKELREKADGEVNLRKKQNMKMRAFRLGIMASDMRDLIEKREGF